MSKYLIVVDMQKDFVDGALGTKEAVAIVPSVKKRIEKRLLMGRKSSSQEIHMRRIISRRRKEKIFR